MLRSVRDLIGYRIYGTDGDIGKVVDCYFDDERWTVRYLVADSGSWLSGRQVLLSPFAVQDVDWNGERVNVRLNRDQVQRSPGVDTAMPISRVHETNMNQYYGWPNYWEGGNIWGPSMWPALPIPGGAPQNLAQPPVPASPPHVTTADGHLQSSTEVIGYRVRAVDGELGRIEDLVIDDASWTVQAIVVDTTPWWPGGEVAVRPSQIEGVVWEHKELAVKQDRAGLKADPAIDLSQYTHRK